MNFYKKQSKHFVYLSLFIGLGFLIYLLLTPLIHNQDSRMLSGRNTSVDRSEQRLSITKEGINSFLTAIETGNEYAVDAVSYHIMNRSQQVSRHLPNLVIYTFAILFIGFGILIRKSRYLLTDTNQHVCVLAMSIGGHAPPGK
jgi:hypothetical protein